MISVGIYWKIINLHSSVFSSLLSISSALLHNEDYTHFSVFSTVVLDGWDIASYISILYLTTLKLSITYNKDFFLIFKVKYMI